MNLRFFVTIGGWLFLGRPIGSTLMKKLFEKTYNYWLLSSFNSS
jgi:hypothetical protein